MLRSGGDGRGAAVLPISCQHCLSWWAMVLLLSSASFVHSGQCNEGLSPVVSVWCSLVLGCWQQTALLDPKGDPLPGGPCGTRSTPCTPGALWAPAGAVMVGKALPAGIPSLPRSVNFSELQRCIPSIFLQSHFCLSDRTSPTTPESFCSGSSIK